MQKFLIRFIDNSEADIKADYATVHEKTTEVITFYSGNSIVAIIPVEQVISVIRQG